MDDIRIPVGTSNFSQIRKDHLYYIDKTGLINELLKKTPNAVTLFTRPRRFGKTMQSISYYDYREDFYHAFMAGIFTGIGYAVDSNKEYGEGRSNVVVKDSRNGRAAIFEMKRSITREDLKKDCELALKQIDARKYVKQFEGVYNTVLCYGLSFYKKQCLVLSR